MDDHDREIALAQMQVTVKREIERMNLELRTIRLAADCIETRLKRLLALVPDGV
jgi:hypothetical protein